MVPSTILVRWNQQVQSISFHHATSLSFEELLKQVNVLFKDIRVSSYNLVTKGQHVIHDDQTLQQELLRDSKTNTRPELTLQPKSDHSKKHKVPVIKPTVLRWTESQDTIGSQRYSPSSPLGKRISLSRQLCEDNHSSSDDDGEGSCTRKDSGVSMEEPSKKKQRVQSVDTSTAVMLPLSRNHRHQSYNNNRPSSPSPSHSHTIHPLEMRRPSTAPSSPITIKLPALSSITSSPPLDNDPSRPPQLAPLQQSPQRQHFYLPAMTSPHPSPMSLSSSESFVSRKATITNSTAAPSLSPPTPCLEQTHSHHSTFRRHHHHQHHYRYSYQHQQHSPQRPSIHHPHQRHQQHFHPDQKHSGQFLCKQVIDASSGRICGQTFRRSYDLSRHQTIHLKNRPFCYCDQCGKKFTRMDALRRHERVQGHTSKQHLLQQSGPTSTTSPSQPLASSHLYRTPPPQSISYPSTTSSTRPFVDLRKAQPARV